MRVITPMDAEWPSALRQMEPHVPPTSLFIDGDPLPARERAVSIVGTRRPTVAGRETARLFARALAEAGFTVVSGFALGIDTHAHMAALEAGGKTVAVLGCGLDVEYPKENVSLRRQIVTSGSVVTEYDPGTMPHRSHFPERNRIIAGLASAVIVVEGGQRSGASITAGLAFDMGRDCFAVPGSIRNPYAACPNELIRTDRARLVTDPQHIFDEIAPSLVWDGTHVIGSVRGPKLEDLEADVLRAIDDAPASAEEIRDAVGEPPGKVALALAKLEVRGLIGRRYTGAYEISQGGVRALGAMTS